MTSQRGTVDSNTGSSWADRGRPVRFGADDFHCGDVHLAEELAPEALIKACQRWDRVRGLESPVGWCYRVAMNASNSWFRRNRIERRTRRRLSNQQLSSTGIRTEWTSGDPRDPFGSVTPQLSASLSTG